MGVRLLIADDDEATRGLLRRRVASWGYEPTVVSDGDAALTALLAPDAPPIALLDWMMPGHDGVEICRLVRSQAPFGRTILFLLTAKGGPDDLLEGLKAGADDYLTKPFDLDELRGRLAAAARGRSVGRDESVAPAPQPASHGGPRPAAGDVVAGRYRLERHVAEGGMGTVWEGRHVELGTPVAVKFVHAAHISDARVRARFEMEARATSLLDSSHVTKVLDYGVTASGVPYLVMEWLRGRTLAHAIDERGALPAWEFASMLRQIARGLALAHHQGIVHRDLKPENIFLAELGDETLHSLPYRAKILDFGIAKVLDDAPSSTPRHRDERVSQDGLAVGTLSYMSPEQLMGQRDVGPPSDLFALGAVAFLAMTGQGAFEGETIAEVAHQICRAPLPVPSAHGLVPKGFDAWFARACARRPEDRHGSVQEMAAELTALVPRGGGRASVAVTADVAPGPLARAGASTATAIVAGDGRADETELIEPAGVRRGARWRWPTWVAATLVLATACAAAIHALR